MRTNLKYVWMLAAALVLGVSSCSKDEAGPVDGGEIVAGQDTWVTVNLTSPKTYATHPGTAEESVIQTIDVAIYDNASGVLVSHRQIAGLGGVANWNGRLQTKTGASRIFVGANLPAAVSAQLPGSTQATLEAIIATLSVADVATDNQFVMSSSLEAATFADWDGTGVAPGSNDITISVKRLAAKFTVEKKAGLNFPIPTDGGEIAADLRFAVGQMNTQSYIVQNIVGGMIVDPTYSYPGPFPAPGLTGDPLFTEFIPVDAAGTATDDLVAKYALENTNDNMLTGNLTYVAISASFMPHDEATYTAGGGPGTLNVAGNIQPPGTTFYMVEVTGGKLYFYNQAEATAYLTEDPDGDIVSTSVAEYTNATCYYTVYVNGLGTGYDVYRNDFYKSTVASITGLGDPAPGPIDPTQPPGGTTNIDVTITVEPWELIEEEFDLTPQ